MQSGLAQNITGVMTVSRLKPIAVATQADTLGTMIFRNPLFFFTL